MSSSMTPNHQEIFTDGSTSSNKVSAAAVFLNSKLTFFTNLPTMSSIFTAELTAVKIAIQYTQNKPQTPYPIFRLSQLCNQFLTKISVISLLKISLNITICIITTTI